MRFEQHDVRLALFNWGIRAGQYYMANQAACPLPKRVAEFKNQIKNANDPLQIFVGSSDKYEFDRNSKVSFTEFFVDMREHCRKEQPEFKFDQKDKFRQHLRNFKFKGSNKLELKKTGGTEYIIGIVSVIE